MADERDIRALRHYVARLEDELAEEEYQHARAIIKLENAREHISDQALDIVTLGQEVGRLREALTKTHSELFAAIHYRGYEGGPLSEPSARLAERIARAAIAEKKEK